MVSSSVSPIVQYLQELPRGWKQTTRDDQTDNGIKDSCGGYKIIDEGAIGLDEDGREISIGVPVNRKRLGKHI